MPHTSTITPLITRVALAAAGAVLLLLAALHALSPEFDPAWRMVSEYANGQYPWVLSLMFVAWAISSWALAVALRAHIKTLAARVGWGFLIAAGVGEAMAALFDINHGLHGLAALIGMGSLPIAALLISLSLSRTPTWANAKQPLVWTANLTWISVVLMLASFIILMVTYSQVGGDMTSQIAPATLPAGVIAFVGWANRFLIIVYGAWVMTAAWLAMQAQQHLPHPVDSISTPASA